MTNLIGNENRPNNNMNYENNPKLQQSLKLMKEAVQGEREDQLFYEYLIEQAPTQEEKEIIASIRDDEVKHNRMFRQLYKLLTGQEVSSTNGEEFVRPDSYIDGIKKALFGELKAVEKYRTIRQGLPGQLYRDMLFEIITDELKHASKYNFLYTLNRTETVARENNDHSQSTEEIDNAPIQTIEDNDHAPSQTAENNDSLPDQWVQYIQPLVTRAMEEVKEGINLTHLFQEFILAGVLVGNQFTPEQAIEQVEQWEKSGESKLLQESKMMKE